MKCLEEIANEKKITFSFLGFQLLLEGGGPGPADPIGINSQLFPKIRNAWLL